MTDLLLSQPFKLPCGLTLPNRLAKAALAEEIADCQHLPTTTQLENAYGAWADGGWGMVMTGNVQVDEKYLGGHRDLAVSSDLPEEKVLEAYKKFVGIMRRKGTPAIMQINHPGRQSPLGAGKKAFMDKNLAPSPIQLNMGDDFLAKIITNVVFGTPKEMSVEEIEDVVQSFARTARIASEAGFDGVEIHAAHGYLLSQFMSEKSNQRTDAYGGSPAARAKIIVDVAKAIRAATPAGFCVGLKFNSADHQSPKELEEVLEQITLIAEVGLDFLEVSGGSYENPSVSVPSIHSYPHTNIVVDVHRNRREESGKHSSPRVLLPLLRSRNARQGSQRSPNGNRRLPHTRRHGSGPSRRRLRSDRSW